MATLAELTVIRTKEQVFTQLIQALQGVGFVKHTGYGTGRVAASGIATATASAIIKIFTAGAVGVATFKVSLDSGVTYGAEITTAATYVIPSTGVTLAFTGTFITDETYSFRIAIPTFPATSWHDGSVPKTLLEVFSEAFVDVDTLISALTYGGYLDGATGAWLDLLVESLYDEERGDAVTCLGYVTLTDAAMAGPFTISVNQLWCGTVGGLRFNNVAGGILAQGSTLTLLFQAEGPGASWNVGAGEITQMLTSLPGVTCVNPSDWLTVSGAVQGADEETDASIRTRCKSKWGTLGIAANEDGYDYWARTSTVTPPAGVEVVTRTKIETDSIIPGQVNVFLAGDSGAVNASTITHVDTYIQPRVPLTSTCVVAAASNLAVAVAGTVHVQASYATSAQTAAEAALVALFKAVEIGGDTLISISGLSRERIIDAIMQTGVIDLNLTSPATDVVMTAYQVATLTDSLTWASV